MGFLDSFRARLRGDDGDDYYEDDYYDEAEDEAGYAPASRRADAAGSAPRLLGNTPRPEAESVSVYTRSGRPVGSGVPASVPSPARTSYESQETNAIPRGGYIPGAGIQGMPQTISQLPPYVLRPVSYDDVQTVVRRARTNQPVVLVFKATAMDVAKRILDFSFGFATGIEGEVKELGDRVFAVVPAGCQITESDVAKLKADGDIEG